MSVLGAITRFFHLDVTDAVLREQRERLERVREMEDEAQSKVTAGMRRLALALNKEVADGRR